MVYVILTATRKGTADAELAKRETERKKRRRHTTSDNEISESSGDESDTSAPYRRSIKDVRESQTQEGSIGRRQRSPSYSVSDSAPSASRSPSPPAASVAARETNRRALGREVGHRRTAPTLSRSESRSRSASSFASSRVSRSLSPPTRKRERGHKGKTEKGRPTRPHDHRIKAEEYFGQDTRDTKDTPSWDPHDCRDTPGWRRRQHEARSPERGGNDQRAYRERDDSLQDERFQDGRYSRRISDTGDGQNCRQDRKGQERDRSLSPFSQRLALTRKLQSGR